jgi:broad specificity phosphatase PhoE
MAQFTSQPLLPHPFHGLLSALASGKLYGCGRGCADNLSAAVIENASRTRESFTRARCGLQPFYLNREQRAQQIAANIAKLPALLGNRSA